MLAVGKREVFGYLGVARSRHLSVQWFRKRRIAAAIWTGVALVKMFTPPALRADVTPAPANEWSMFRGGPSLQGVSAAKLSSELKLVWTHKLGQPVRSSAAIKDDCIYVGSDDGFLYALDLQDGHQLWKFKTDGPIESSPLILNGTVFFGSGDAFVYAVDAKSGLLKWKHETLDQVLGSPNWVDAPDGGTPWILAGSYDFNLYCLNAATGKTNWVYETANYINGSPAVFQGKTVFGGCDAILHVLDLKTGKPIKEIDAGAYIAGSATVVDQMAYVGHYDNEVLGVDLEKGEVIWRYKDRSFPYFSSPAVSGDRVVFGGRDKKLHCVNRFSGKSLWSFPTRGKVDSSPVILDGKVVVGSEDGRLYLIDLEQGHSLWSYEIGKSIHASPAVVDHRVVIGAEDGNVYCFGDQTVPALDQ